MNCLVFLSQHSRNFALVVLSVDVFTLNVSFFYELVIFEDVLNKFFQIGLIKSLNTKCFSACSKLEYMPKATKLRGHMFAKFSP